MGSVGVEEGTVIRVARRVYVGNLNWRTSWQELKDHFSVVGPVRFADVLREGGPGSRSKGCGIVEFETPEAAAAAIEGLNGTELDGRQVFVREDREDFELGGGGGPPLPGDPGAVARPSKRIRGVPAGGAVSVGRRVYVGNLSFYTGWQELKDHFKAAGPVLHADVLMDGEGRSKGCGIVEFESPTDALRAISLLSNSRLGDRTIMVREDREDPSLLAAAGPALGGMGLGGLAMGGARFSADRRPLAGAGPRFVPAPEGCQVVVHGLPYKLAWQELKDLCRAYGAVTRADVATNPDGSSKGYGLVAFASPADAATAIQALNGAELEGRVLTAKYDRFV